MKLCVKTWSLDKDNQVHVRRHGFPIVPDFGGTAHAYCGDTLKAIIGDLMHWHHIPNLDNALRAYIIKSRVRHHDNLLLAQPYSPMLFRQGVQPGPHLLLQVLRGDLLPKEAKKDWKEFNATREDARAPQTTWMQRLTIPCRRCTDLMGKEILKPLTAFSTLSPSMVHELWESVLSLGQDATCLRCMHAMDPSSDDTNIFCEACCNPRPCEYFSPEAQRLWNAAKTFNEQNRSQAVTQERDGRSSQREQTGLSQCNSQGRSENAAHTSKRKQTGLS